MHTLLEKVRGYLPGDRAEMIERALDFATDAHEGQKRRSGEDYIQHPISVAEYLADLNLDAPTIAAALLHDVIEDCDVTADDLRAEFGDDVAKLADGVTKLTRMDTITGDAEPLVARTDSEAESLRKMLVAMANDIRVVLIKLADRMHNMRTLHALPPDRRVAIAQETLDIYAPLAHRLGMGEVKWQLEDLAFRYIQPNQYRSISSLLATKRTERESYVKQVTGVLRDELAKAGFDAEVTGRPKHIYSIHRKAQSYAAQGKQMSDIYDLFAVRVLVNTVQDCYGVLGLVHSIWHPVPGQFDDYIANPKENMYQSLHTTVRSIDGLPVEVQVRTHEMHRISEYGVASHWSYKEGGARSSQFEERMTWLRQLLEWQRDVSMTDEFLENVTGDLFRDQVFVYTPKNEVRELPAGATPIDFAYRIHTEIGHRCIGAKVNGRLVALNTPLKNGDTVEVLTSKVARGPSLDWLNPHLDYVKTASARQAIRSWFRHQERGTNVERGRAILKKELKRLSAQVDEAEVARWFHYDSIDDLYAAIGSGLVTVAQIAGRLSAAQQATERTLPRGMPDTTDEPVLGSVSVLGVGDLLTRMGECCNPLPGDEIEGFVTRTRGVTVHKVDCPNVRNVSETDRIVPVTWGQSRNVYPARIIVECFDRVGLLHDITGATSAEHVNIAGSLTEPMEGGMVVIHLNVQVTSIEQLSRLFTRIEGVRGVRGVSRTAQKPPPKSASRNNASSRNGNAPRNGAGSRNGASARNGKAPSRRNARSSRN
ncbi:MAG: bifunctional (p)ppGpp synthetase/guanosine-3',5'-bis(diphosphate) 3'-pyrophosphohydrolase [Chloroflexota bacterium]|nr:bifunctional (p)ppGpp synthetase/guanosine-3',5'-bis(diphosphate) 3'-pyrophosphohydrolase [Chloroflexota bacterium]MDE2883925.1 bifunctional (p)ppGpp synthetase/guanosine-3',5'-bis(diphosphate) 3'-pyrophosphohydrolase [Chloroflexota bacterium]